jgi:hypothetical protein
MLPTLGLYLTILWPGALPGSTDLGEEVQSERPGVAIRGRVVDDETGHPIESFTLEYGRLQGQDPAEIAWGGQSRSVPNEYTIVNGKTVLTGRNPLGEFADSLEVGEDGTGHRRWLRVVADGYEPRPVTDRPPEPTDAGKTIEVTVRLRRGRPLFGRVVDHAGRPAAGAKLCLIRPSGGRVRVVDEVIGEGSDTGILDPAVTRTVADEQGRFRITGVGGARALGVSAPTLHFWTVPIPAPGEELTVRLPEPATLRFPYDIDGDAPETAFWLHVKPPEDLAERLWVTRNVVVANRGEAILHDATPGEYTLWRSKTLTVGQRRWRTPVEHRALIAESGHTTVVDFVRSGGGPIAGAVSGPEGGGARMIFVGIEPVRDDTPAFESPRFPLRLLDIVACGEGGRFQTAGIPPGRYVAHAVGYRTGPRYEPFGIFNDAPDFIGSTPVTVPPDGNPPAVRIVLASRKQQSQPAK